MTGPQGADLPGLGPAVALLTGLVLAAIVAPVVLFALPGAFRDDQPSTRTDPPTTTTTTAIATAGPDDAVTEPSVLVLQVVPAVRDLSVVVDGQMRTSDAAGRVRVTIPDGDAAVTVLGYSVTPAVQEVAFIGWADGSRVRTRTVRSTGAVTRVDLGVEIRYRVTAVAGGTVGPVVLRRDDEVTALPLGVPTWVPAARAVRASDGTLAPTRLTYRTEVDGQTVGEPLELTPEALVGVG